MIEIKNNGKKIVHVGKVALLPGETTKVADKVAATPAIKILEKKNLLTLTEVKETTATSTETAKTKTTTATKKATATTAADTAKTE